MEDNYRDRWQRDELKELLESKQRGEKDPKYNPSYYGNIDARIAIQEKVVKIQELLRECEDIADKNDVSFYTPGPEYGLGATYYPKTDQERSHEGWNPSNVGC